MINDLKNIVQEKGISSNVSFTGMISEQDMPAIQPQGLKKTNPYAVEPGVKPETVDLGDVITLSTFDSFFPDYSELSADEKENFLRGLNNDDIEYSCSI